MMGRSLYISLSSGWSWIKCHLLIKMFLRFGKVGWYVVAKGRIFFRTSLFFCKADFRSVNLTAEVISQTTDSHFANYRFSFHKLQIVISFRSISFRKLQWAVTCMIPVIGLSV